MSPRIPPDGAHARCVLAAIDGLDSIEESRLLGRQAAGFVAAAGGVVIDHEFLCGPAAFGLRMWAVRHDLVTFAAGMRASLRCLVDRPGHLWADGGAPRIAPRVVVNVALSPRPDPLSAAVLGQLDGGVDPVRIADLVRALAEGRGVPEAAADPVQLEQATALLRLRPEGVPLVMHLISLHAKFGLARPVLSNLDTTTPPPVAVGRMDA